MDTSLIGRTALVTGGSLGIGLASAEAFYRAGARVAITARRADVLDQACAALAQCEAPAEAAVRSFTCDVSNPEQLREMFAAVTAEFGGVDILVNNAGHAAAKPFVDLTDEDWYADIDLKLMAAVRLTRLVWPHMQSQSWGRIINLLNVFAKTPDARTAPTSVTRAAGMALTKVLAGEGAPHNILVNAMLIGSIRSDQIARRYEQLQPDQSFEEFVAAAGVRLPMGRMGEPEEAANLALFLASPAGSYITGCAINMDGGLSRVV
jgi:NAD(P)-dependent dehydrogenase (short-subunit alcohol dehydrogenase family)